MGVFYETIPQSMIDWILNQKVFWVATAPLSGSGHVNVSPKGGQYFGVKDEKTFWYMDLTGSGNETISHLHEPGNGRITIQLNAFEGGPKIVRLWGKGRVLENGTKEFEDHIQEHNVQTIPGTRSIIVVDIHQVGSSCGFSVPFYDFKEFRPTLNDHFAKKVAKYEETGDDAKDSMDAYWAYKNAWSMDGMPGMRRGLNAGKKYSVEPLKKMVGPLANPTYHYQNGVPLLQVIVIAILAFLTGLVVMIYQPELQAVLRNGIKGSRLEPGALNLSHIPAVEGLATLWTTK